MIKFSYSDAVDFMTKKWPIVIGLVLLAYIFSINLVLIILSLVFLYRFCRNHLNNPDWFNSVTFVGSVTGILYMLLLLIVSSTAGFLYGDFDIRLTPFLTLLLLLLSAGYYRRVLKRPALKQLQRLKPFTTADVFSLTGALIVVVLTIASPLIRGGIAPYDSISLINGGVDDSVHLALLNDRLYFNQTNFADRSPKNVRTADKLSYPAGWHTSNAIALKSFAPHIKTGLPSLYAYIVTKIFWYFMLCFLIFRIAFQFSENTRPWLKGFTLLAGLVFCYALAVPQFLYGFYSFMPLLISLLLLSILSITGLPNKQFLRNQDSGAIALIALVCLAGGISWLLLVPTMMLGVFGMIYFTSSKQSPLGVIRTISASVVTYPFLYILLLGTLFGQIYTSAFSDSSVSFMQDLMLAGGVAQYGWPIVAVTTFGVLYYLHSTRKLLNLIPILWTVSALLLAAGGIYLLQLIVIGRPEYYYFKVVGAILLVAAPLAIAGYVRLLDRFSTAPAVGVAYSLCLIGFIGITLIDRPSLTTNTLDYLTRTQTYTKESAAATYAAIDSVSEDAYGEARYSIFYDPGQTSQNFTSTMIAKANSVDSPCFRAILGKIVFGDQSTEALLAPVRDSCRVAEVNIYTSAPMKEPLTATFGTYPNVHVFAQ